MENTEQLFYYSLGVIFLFVYFILAIWVIIILIKKANKKLIKLRCKSGIHKWIPVYIRGTYNEKEVKFIACFCDHCRYGYDEVLEINEIALNKKYGTYSEKYFKT